MQPKQENESAAVWGEKYANWLGRVNEVAERRLGTTFDNLGDIARWEIANSKTGSSANADSGENGNTGATDTNTKNPTGDFIEPELETAYVTAGQAQAGDRAAIAQAQDYADSVATEVENKTKDYAAQVATETAATAANNAIGLAAQVATETAATAENNAKGYAANVATAAESKAKQYATSVATDAASTAQTNAEGYAAQVATETAATAENNAKGYASQIATKAADSAKNAAETHADKAATEAKSAAVKEAKDDARAQVTAAEKRSNAHADATAKKAEVNANDYTDQQMATAEEYATTLAHSTIRYANQSLQESKSYTDRVARGLQKQINHNGKAIKRLGASAQATANLHYNANHNGYAIAVGEYNSETALAGGLQFNTGKSTAVTVQGSYDAESFGGSVGLHGDW
ncbi:hypothetical protein K7R23_00070 [Citrobacter rodentium NBRC 105723 = DSM 16636]|nr:hypothetical protein [Citrobacter rodentium]UHO31188.1 hypothetical protein K7R23_00070 [Citrobacter rodentium NBRC 105723 = DSM 16636]